MVLRKLIGSLALAVGFTSAARAGELQVNKDRSLLISGVIAQGNILKLAGPMYKLANDNTKLPIDLIISSPGGEVETGLLFINLMEDVKARGTPIRCFVPTLAASMAFQIFVHCSERHVLDRGLLLWHRVRVMLGGGLFSGGAVVTAPVAAVLARDLGRMDALTLNELQANIDMDDREILYHFNNETLHVGEQLAASAPGFVKAHKAITNLFDVLTDPKTARNPDVRGIAEKAGKIIYIWNHG